MKKNISNSILYVTVLSGTFLFSCTRDKEVSPQAQNVNAVAMAEDNNQIILATQESMDAADGALTDQGVSDGSASTSGRFENSSSGWSNCGVTISGSFTLDNTHPDSLIYKGSLTIDYGDGSSCSDTTNIKKGKMIDDFAFIFNRRNVLLSASQNIRFSGFSRGKTLIDGTFIAKSSKTGNSSVEFQGAKFTYKDGTSVSWAGMLAAVYTNGGTKTRSDDTRTINGSLSGTTREGVNFSANITKEILFKYSCPNGNRVPVSGTIAISTSSSTSSSNTTIDYGDGTCDRKYVITANGTAEVHNL